MSDTPSSEGAEYESGIGQKLGTMFFVLVGFQMLTFAFVFHIWLTQQGVAGSKADPEANLLITGAFALMATPLAFRLYGRVRGVAT